MLIAAHAKLFGASLHAATHHQPIPRLEDVQRAGHSRVGHGANEYRDVLSKTTKEETEEGQEMTKKTNKDKEKKKRRNKGENCPNKV